ncbi:MAG: OmpA family protein [Gammaproteobacteria bacterium]
MKSSPSMAGFRRRAPAKQKAEKKDFLTGDSLKLWTSVSAFIGAYCLFSYFLYIDYFPQFDLAAVASYFFSIAFVCIIVGMGLLFVLLSPYLGAGVSIRSNRHRQGSKAQHNEIAGWMLYLAIVQIFTAIAIAAYIMLRWDWGWALVLAASFAVLAAYGFARTVLPLHMKKYPSLYPTVVGGPQTSFTAEALKRAERLKRRRKVSRIFLAKTAWAILLSAWQLVPGLLFLTTLDANSASPLREFTHLVSTYSLAVCYLAVAGGVLLALGYSPTLRRYLLVAVPASYLLLQYLLFISQQGGLLPMTFARITKTGNYRASKIVLSAKACETVGPMLSAVCNGDKPQPIQLCNVHIMSRVGTETYLRLADQYPGRGGKFAVRHIFVPTAEISAMQVDFDTKMVRLESIDEDLGKKGSDCADGPTILYGDSAFGFDSFVLTEAGKAQLSALVNRIKNNAKGIREVVITGHADNLGKEAHNNWLAERRAIEVQLLMNRELRNVEGRPAIRTISAGSTEPLVFNCTEPKKKVDCEAPNRRVEITVVSTASPAGD